jgi:hypothetical protein
MKIYHLLYNLKVKETQYTPSFASISVKTKLISVYYIVHVTTDLMPSSGSKLGFKTHRGTNIAP